MITKEELQEIIDLVEQLPEKYREKSFELILLEKLRPSGKSPALETEVSETKDKEQELARVKKSFIVPIDVRALLSQYTMKEDVIWKVFLIEDEEVRPIYKLDETSKAKAQTKLALLMSLENALIGGKFEVTIEALRERCRDHKVYDLPNFSANIKNNAKLFKKSDEVESLELSPNGKAELAEVLEEFSVGNGKE